MKVLIACEFSQVVCFAFREKGHEAYSCDIQFCSGGHPEWHIQQDVLPLIDGDCSFYTCDGHFHHISGKWDIIIAHPPCTYLSKAGACRLYPVKGVIDMERYQKGLLAKDFFVKLLNADCPCICIENPVSLKIFNLPAFSQEVEPFMFGHPYTKKTRLWLKGLPLLKPTNIVIPVSPFCPSFTSRKISSKYGLAARGNDSNNRSVTFIGLAAAMAEQWG